MIGHRNKSNNGDRKAWSRFQDRINRIWSLIGYEGMMGTDREKLKKIPRFLSWEAGQLVKLLTEGKKTEDSGYGWRVGMGDRNERIKGIQHWLYAKHRFTQICVIKNPMEQQYQVHYISDKNTTAQRCCCSPKVTQSNEVRVGNYPSLTPQSMLSPKCFYRAIQLGSGSRAWEIGRRCRHQFRSLYYVDVSWSHGSR